MSLLNEHRFPNSAALAKALATEIKVDLNEALALRGTASLVVSGGRTPVALFEQLRGETLDWSQVWITLADERWVDTGSNDSNEHLVRTTLLKGRAADARFLGLKNAAATPEAGVEWAWRGLKRVPRPYDVVVLGMGDDGHTASLFPGSLSLAKALDPATPSGCVAVNALAVPHARISMNLAALLDSLRIVLLLSGAQKWAVYERAREPGSMNDMPIRAVLQQKQVRVDVYWSP